MLKILASNAFSTVARKTITRHIGAMSAGGDLMNKNTQFPTPESIPRVDLPVVHPKPVRREFSERKLSTKDLESIPIYLGYHYNPQTIGDYVAYRLVKTMRIPTDIFFKNKYIHRAVMLETVAAVPGMVAGMLRHLTSLRTMRHDGGWIHHLLHEAENERMHLMTWMKIIEPTYFDRAIVLATQGVFFNLYFLMYLFFPKVSHRMVGYLEEEAVKSYTEFIKEIDEGNIENTKAPEIAIWYWNLESSATLRDVVLAIRADEASHRDVNHHFAERMKEGKVDLRNEQ